jgi:Ser/Thr protein kinase RdoA (MazF antagonist)
MLTPSSESHDRYGIYYWKCDRAVAFHGTRPDCPVNPLMEAQLLRALEKRFPGIPVELYPAQGQGNHRTFRLTLGEQEAFARLEDGPDHDDYFAVESLLLTDLKTRGIPVPRELACDCARTETPFAWQLLEYIPHPDLNHYYKQGLLALEQVAGSIGEAIARWQALRPRRFGPFSAFTARRRGVLVGLHDNYESYFMLNLTRHLDFLVAHAFFTDSQAGAIMTAIESRRQLLAIPHGCLVHKDLALWNILGTPQRIAAYIDWDDAVSGDPMDDLSLLGCFYDAPVIECALAGYACVRPLPENHLPRFWLHLLRNMLVKAVIRVGAGYFNRNDTFFLIDAGATGSDLESFTRRRIETAIRGLCDNLDLAALGGGADNTNHS